MNRFDQLFKQKQAFIAYITAGQRGLDYTEKAVKALVAGGVDILEIGIPFSDPVADGPTIQNAMKEALTHSITIDAVLKTIKNIRKSVEAPIVLFTYYNPLLVAGVDETLRKAKDVGVDGMLVVDLPLEESKLYFEKCRLNGIRPICLIAPSTDAARIKEISEQCHDAFLYYVCRNGITGVKNALPEDYAEKISIIKSVSNSPVVSGFGIGDRELAREALRYADGFVVGSAFVKAISDGATPEDLKALAMKIDPR